MNKKKLENIKLFTDMNAINNNEPGIYHSYMVCLATALNYIMGDLDPVWLMGSSAFAFRIFINEIMCPSAMSVFSFKEVLPKAIEQAGYNCIYVQRMWDETDKEEIKRKEAHSLILEGLERGVPAIVWDLCETEWGLIIGYNDEQELYYILSHEGKESSLNFNKLGRNGIDILSVAIPGKQSLDNRDERIINSLKIAVSHAEGKEWIDERPKYQNGIAAFDLWASIFEKWAWIVDAGKDNMIKLDTLDFAGYYAGHYYSARCYARDYLKQIAKGNKYLQKASTVYSIVAEYLKPLWLYFSENKKPDSEILKSFAQNIINAKSSEKEGIELIKTYLNQ
jgi:hypothetical protein